MEKQINKNMYFFDFQESQGKKTQKLIYMEKFLRYQNAETPE